MNNTAPPDGAAQTAQWDLFWRSEGPASAQRAIRLPVLEHLWREILADVSLKDPDGIVLELAAGAGSVSHHVADQPHLNGQTLVAFDASIHALAMTQRGEHAVAGDLRACPFADQSVNLLTSQFGVEYAGQACLADSLDLVAPGGYFAFVLHIENGVIHQECGRNGDLVRRFMQTPFLRSAEALLGAIFERNEGEIRQATAAAFRQALSDVEQMLMGAAEGQGKDTLLQVYNAVADMIEAPGAFHPQDLTGWFASTGSELIGYIERMSQMQLAALSEKELQKFISSASAAGFTIVRDGLVMDRDAFGRSLPVAFHVLGHRAEEAWL